MEVITEHKVVPKLRFGEFRDDWKKKQLLDFCRFFSGGTPSSSNREYYEGDIPFIGSGDIYDSQVFKFISQEAFNSSSAKLVEKGDLLYALYGANSGDSAISKLEGAINQAILCIRTNESNEYLNYLLVSNKDKIVSKYLQGGQGNLSAQIIKRLRYNMPSLEEQQKIASFLSAVDAKLQQLTKKAALLEAYKKGLMQKIFSRQLRFKDEFGNNFPDWEEKKLGEFCDITTGKSNREDSGLDGEYTFFDRSEDIRKSSIYLFDAEAVIVAGEGSSFPPKYFKGKFDLHQRTYAIMGFENLFGRYLFYYLHQYKNYFVRYAVGSTVKSLRLPIFKKMNIHHPSFEEQKKIANFLLSIDKKIELVSTQIENTKAFKKGLLQQMFV